MEANGKFKRWLGIATLVLVMGTAAKAEFPEYVKVKPLGNQRFILDAQNPQKQTMSMALISSIDGELVYSKDISGNAKYHVVYNLGYLPDGGYTLKYMIANKIYEKEILLKDSEATLLTETSYVTPLFYRDDKNLVVTVFNPEKKDVSVSFWKGSESFFTDNPGDFSFRRQYSLESLSPGEYNISVVKGNDNYSYAFIVE